MKEKVLYVEDDESLAFLTKEAMEENELEVVHFDNGKDAMSYFKKEVPDICIFDVMLPKLDGFNLAKNVRQLNSHIPIIFVTARTLSQDKIAGFEIGGDDYLTKPYEIEELLFKIRVFLKRKLIVEKADEVVKIGAYTFDYSNLSLLINQEERMLTQREADLLKMLFENKNKVVKRENILEMIWGKNDYFLGRSLDVFISRLRKYLRSDDSLSLENVHGVGFMLKTL